MPNIFKRFICIFVCFILLDFLVFTLLEKGMIHYYGLHTKAKILVIGHSHTVLGIDSTALGKQLGCSVSKYAIAGANILDRFWMIKHYLDINPDVEVIIYDVDARLFDSEGLSSASYTLFFPFMDNEVMADYLYHQASWEEYYVSKFIKTARFRDQTINIALRGLLNQSENKKTGRLRIQDYRSYLEREQKRKIRINSEDVECFNNTMEYLSSRGKKVILIDLPVAHVLNQIDRPNQEKAVNIFYETDKKYKHIHFLNYNPKFDGNNSLFFDLRHLNEKGKQIITSKLSHDLIAYVPNI